MESNKLGLTVAIAIMIHNIPEGIAVAVPTLAARPDSPWLAFLLASLSGLAEPLGALVALATIQKTANSSAMELQNILAFVAGIMTTVALVELFPEALRHARQTKAPFVAGTVAGVVAMISTELYLS